MRCRLRPWSVCSWLLLAGVLAEAPQAARAADALQSLDLRQVRVEGEIGRRIDITLHNNLLMIDVEKDFLAPFRKRKAKGGYIGLGKLIDAAVRLAAYTSDDEVHWP